MANLCAPHRGPRCCAVRAARVGVQVPGDVPYKEREMGVVGGGFDGGGISTAVVDVASPNARGEQAEEGQEITWRIRRRLGIDWIAGRIFLEPSKKPCFARNGKNTVFRCLPMAK